jgi:4-amino-4-deoxy-L-arabinose transferase
VAALAAVTAFSFQGSRGLYESTEGRYALCAKEMVQGGNWFVPTLGGVPHWSKPPLAYWPISAGLKLFGMNEWGARAFGALAFVITALMVGFLAASMWDVETGRLAGIIYATSVFPVLEAYALNADTLLVLWEVCAIACFWSAVRRPSGGRLGINAMWVFLGLGFLTKGPPALMPFIPIVVIRWARRRAGPPLRVLTPEGVLLFVATGLLWYGLMMWNHPSLFSYYLKDEIVGRVAGAKFNRSPEWYQPLRLYLPPLALGAGLWSFFLWAGFRKRRLYRPEAWRHALRQGDVPLLLAAWFLIPLIIFSLSRSRLPGYVLPLFVPLVLFTARHVRSVAPPARRVLGVALASAAVIVVAKGLAPHLSDTRRDMRALWQLCRAADPAGSARVVLLTTDRMLGLDFYLSRPALRVTVPPAPPAEGHLTLEELAARIRVESRAADASADYLLIVGDEHKASLLGSLRRQGLAAKLYQDPHWLLARVNAER